MPELTTNAAPQFIDFDASRWDLYTEKPGADAAAAELTQAFNAAAAKAFMAMAANTRPYLAIAELRKEMGEAINKHSDVGAADSMLPLENALQRVFGEELQSLGASKRPRHGI